MVFQVNRDARALRQVRAVECVAWEWAVVQTDEPIGVFVHPVGIDAHVVGNHIAGQADTAGGAALREVLVGFLAAQAPGDLIARQRVRRRNCVWVAAHLFDAAGGIAAFPQPDQPKARETPAGQLIQDLVWDLIEAVDWTLKLA